ncbi:RHS repeat-associated core domain-containing protein [Candidatus Amarolinea dominans]|uniref:RHS repeat-associated core domain-containing protein n=1 Tax=Candidatus Amarolinea dominans TaxID=3140696 RepID=UPI0031CC65D1
MPHEAVNIPGNRRRRRAGSATVAARFNDADERRFTGQVLDEVAGGLYFYNARYYDPALGRFISADTLVL